MAKQFIKAAKHPAAPSKRRVEVSDGVRVIMNGLNPNEKAAVESAFRSFTALRRLRVAAVVKSPNGDLYTARVTNDLRLVYRLTPSGARVSDLLSAGAVRYLTAPKRVVRPKTPNIGSLKRAKPSEQAPTSP